jgi:hypothetical protein
VILIARAEVPSVFTGRHQFGIVGEIKSVHPGEIIGIRSKRPELRPTVWPFRPASSRGMQQVRVRVLRGQGDRFDYLCRVPMQPIGPPYRDFFEI